MLHDIIDDSKNSDTVKQMYAYISAFTDLFNTIFNLVYHDISNIYQNTTIDMDDNSINIELTDPSTCSDVKDQVENAILDRMYKHGIKVSPLIAFKVVQVNDNTIKVMKKY